MKAETGYIARILRDGRYQNIDIAQLTDEELHEYFLGLNGEVRHDPTPWAIKLAAWIRDNVRMENEREP